jgi:hypothetical protein
MALKTENIMFDTTDPEGLASWWARAVDGRVNSIAPPFFVVVSRNDGPGLAFIGGRTTRRSGPAVGSPTMSAGGGLFYVLSSAACG